MKNIVFGLIWVILLSLCSRYDVDASSSTNNGSHIVFRERFAGLISSDQIIYSSVKIPSHAINIDITVWAMPSSSLNPVVLFRYDGVPTPSIYDAKYELPSVPYKVRLKDNQPTASQLYIGIWGGELLHSYRYFAGSPVTTTVGVTATISSCSSSLLLTPDCSYTPPLIPWSVSNSTDFPISRASNHLLYNGSTFFTFLVPENVQIYRLIVNIGLPVLASTCTSWLANYNTSTSTFLIGELYLDQPLEDENYLREVFTIQPEALCSKKEMVTILELKYPLPGQWTCKFSLIPGIDAPKGLSLQKDDNFDVIVSINAEVTWIDAIYLDPSSNHDYSSSIDHKQSAVIVAPMNINRNVDALLFGVIHFSSGFVPFPAGKLLNNKQSFSSSMNPLVVFAAPFDSHKGQLLIGGGMEIQLHLRLSLSVAAYLSTSTTIHQSTMSQEAWQAVFADLFDGAVTLHGRIGNFPQEVPIFPSQYKSSKFPAANLGNISLFSENSFSLNSDEGSQEISFANSIDSEHLDVICRIRWTIMKPKLAQFDDSFSKQLYISMSFSNLFYSKAVGIAFDNERSETGLQITFTGCPQDACIHGTCTIQKGEIPTSQCICSYPWAGERCDKLSVTEMMYKIQVSTLVLSNFSMIPGVLFAIYHDFYLIAVGLFTAATASIFYHLCDTDTYCLFDLSFSSLQVLDVLFSTAMMSMVIMLYAPVSLQIHSAFSLFTFSILVSPVAFDPTNPINVILSISFAIIMCSLSWVLWRYRIPVSVLKKLSSLGFHKSSRDNLNQYARVPQQAQEMLRDRDGIPAIDNHPDQGDVEMVQSEYIKEPNLVFGTLRNHELQGYADVEYKLTFEEIGQVLYFAKSGFIGFVFGLLGLYFFASQTRTNYWYTHSLWHFFIMNSAHYLLIGRVQLFSGLRYILDKDLHNLDD